jgi:hypothetical protein
MKDKNLINPPITDEQFFDMSDFKNKKIIHLKSIVEVLQNKMEDIGVDISFITKETPPFKRRRS